MLKGHALPTAIGLTTLLMTPLWLQHVFSTDGGRHVRACGRSGANKPGVSPEHVFTAGIALILTSPIPSAGYSRASMWNISDPLSMCARLYDTLLLAQG